MKYTLHILIALISMFFLHIVLYFSLSDYRFFWEKLKNSDEIIYVDTEDIQIHDSILSLWAEPISTTTPTEDIITDILETSDETESNIVPTRQVVLWEKYLNVLQALRAYEFQELESNTNLFDITDEYPDYYYEYYHPDITLYLFPTKRYEDIQDIFSVLAIDGVFDLNEINNFWSQSFYINLDDSVNDGQVRLVIQQDGITFWLKIKNSEYNTIKDILLEF